MMNKKRINLTVFLLLILTQTLSAKKAQEESFDRYVHPRIYEIDLYDTDSKINFQFNNDDNSYHAELDFSKLVKDDLPLKGDKIIFHYQGTATNNAGTLSAKIYDKVIAQSDKSISFYLPVAENQERKIAENVLKNITFKGRISYILTEDVTENLFLIIYSDIPQPDKKNQFTLKFKKVFESVNTTQEKKDLEQAQKKQIKINEITQVIFDDYYVAPVEPTEEEIAEQKRQQELLEEQARIEKEKAEQEALEKLREEQELQRKKEQEEKDRLLQEELQKALENASNAEIERYSKEYLQDFMIPEEPEVVEEITVIDDEISDPDETDFYGRTLLMKAAQEGNDWKVARLIKAGADINAKDKDGWTALMYAARYQEGIQCIKLLVDAGADIFTKNNFDSSALSIASSFNKNPEVLKTLLSFYQSSDKEVIKSLTLLLSDNHDSEYVQISKINEFIKLSVPLNSYYEGKTPLMYACLYGTSTKVIQILLDNNSISTLRSSEGLTAYDYAKQNKNLNYDRTYWLLNNEKR